MRSFEIPAAKSLALSLHTEYVTATCCALFYNTVPLIHHFPPFLPRRRSWSIRVSHQPRGASFARLSICNFSFLPETYKTCWPWSLSKGCEIALSVWVNMYFTRDMFFFNRQMEWQHATRQNVFISNTSVEHGVHPRTVRYVYFTVIVIPEPHLLYLACFTK